MVVDLVKYSALLYRSPRGITPWFAKQTSGKVGPVERTPKLISNNGFQLLRAALDDEGLAFLPLWGVSKEIEDGRLENITLEDSSLTIGAGEDLDMYMLYHPKKTRLGKVRVLVDFLLEALVIP
jgi:DNA-binding transcriptional LysR family regulator